MNLRVGTFGPQRETCILCDLYIRPDCWEEFKRHPYRSPEYYHGRKEITGVAVLTRDPKLDLGMLSFSGRPGCFYFALEGESPRTPPDTSLGTQQAETGIDPTQPPRAEPTPPAAADPDMPAELRDVPADWHGHFARCMKHYAASAFSAFGFPGGMNSSVPAPAREDHTHMATDATPTTPAAPAAPAAETEAQRMAREQQAAQFARHEQEIAALKAQLGEQERRAERALVEKTLVQFENENPGISYQRAVELERMLPLSGEQRGEHLQYMRDHYRRDSGKALTSAAHQGVIATPDNGVMFARGDDPAEFAANDLHLANAYMRQNPGCSWAKAREYAINTRLGKK
jgi:hypothetical protein